MPADETAAGVFGLLADETRVDIVQTIARAQAEEGAIGEALPTLTFSAIYERVDVENTSKFSYHLGELEGVFLRKSEDGYGLTHAGERVARMLLAGNFERTPQVAPQETSGECPYCGEVTLEASLEDQFYIVRCQECDRGVLGYGVTPAQVRSVPAEDLLDHVTTRQTAEYRQVCDGSCPLCGGGLSTHVIDGTEQPLPGPIDILVRDICDHCLRDFNAPLPYRVAHHPASVAFHWDHGIDILDRGMLAMHRYVVEDRWHAEGLDGDRERYRVVLEAGPAALAVTLDEDLQVVRTERVRGERP